MLRSPLSSADGGSTWKLDAAYVMRGGLFVVLVSVVHTFHLVAPNNDYCTGTSTSNFALVAKHIEWLDWI